MTSIEFKMNFLSPALFENGDLLAKANLVKRGRKVALCDVEVCCERTFFLFIVLNSDDSGPNLAGFQNLQGLENLETNQTPFPRHQQLSSGSGCLKCDARHP